jgi:hypothetical protein
MIPIFRLILVLLCTFLAVILTLEVKTTKTFDARDFLAIERSGELQYDDDDVIATEPASEPASVPNCQPTTDTWVSNRTGKLPDPGEDAGIAHTMSLTRPRPRNLRLAFLGDSVTRYQYLSLAYFLRWGRWFDPDTIKNHLVDAHSFRHPYHPDQDWNEFFLQSNRLLYPAESCDCQRSSSSQHEHAWAVERRYFYDPVHNNTLTYINLSGNETDNPNPSKGYAGRLHAPDIFTNFQAHVGLPSGLLNSNAYGSLTSSSSFSTASNSSWDYPTWGQVIRHHVAALVPKPEIAILNAGLHAHNFGDPSVRQELVSALNASNIIGIWKTTTPQKSELVGSATAVTITGSSNQSSSPLSLRSASASHNAGAVLRTTDRQMCQELSGCFNLSWTVHLRPDLYFDDLHFREPIYRIMNEDLLQQLNKLPAGYEMMDRSIVLV